MVYLGMILWLLFKNLMASQADLISLIPMIIKEKYKKLTIFSFSASFSSFSRF